MSICTLSRCRMQRICTAFNSFVKKRHIENPQFTQQGSKPEKIVLPSATIIQEHGYRAALKRRVYNLRPLDFQSGDLVELEPLKPTEIHYLYKDIKELEDAPEELRKLFTLDFATGKQQQQHRHLVVQDRISNVVGSAQNLEKYIGYLTVKIRSMMPYVQNMRQNKRAKVLLKEKIEKRQKLLKLLSRCDYDRFIWLLKELKLEYKPKTPESFIKISKREKIIRAAADETVEQKKEKMEKVRERFAKEKDQFMEYKKKVLEEIEQDIEKYQLDKGKLIQSYKDHLESLNPRSKQKPSETPRKSLQ